VALVRKIMYRLWPATPAADGVTLKADVSVQVINRVLPFAVLIVSVMAAEYVSVEADPIKGVLAAMVNPEMVMLESRLDVVTSATLKATVGVANKFSLV
jgi:hypothetical protein